MRGFGIEFFYVMKCFSRNILLLVLAVIGAVPMIAGSKDADDAAMRRDKARYVYLEAIKQREADNDGAFFDLIRHAYALDSTNTAISYCYGLAKLMRPDVTRDDAMRGAELMRKHFEAHPEDY